MFVILSVKKSMNATACVVKNVNILKGYVILISADVVISFCIVDIGRECLFVRPHTCLESR